MLEKNFSAHLNTTFHHEPEVLNEIPDAPNNVIEESPI